MKAAHSLCLTLTLSALVASIYGLELTLEEGGECGVLKCKESGIPKTQTITQFTIYKILPGDSGKGEPIQLTKANPSISASYSGDKASGLLEKRKASLTVKLNSRDACTAKFTCEVRKSDGAGNELVQSSTISQPEGEALTEISAEDAAQIQEHVTGVTGSIEELLTLQENIDTQVAEKISELEEKLCTSAGDERSVARLLADIREEIRDHQSGLSSWEKQNEDRFDDLMDVKQVMNSEETFCERLETDLSEVYRNLYDEFEELRANMKNSSRNTASAVEDLIADVNKAKYLSGRGGGSVSSSSGSEGGRTSPADECIRGMKDSAPCLPARLVVFPKSNSEVSKPYLCDTDTDFGGWIVIQRRYHFDVDFYRTWDEYRKGFGDLVGNGDFWWGLDAIHDLVNCGSWELRVEVRHQNGKSAYAEYEDFSIDGPENDFTLRLGKYRGTAGDSLTQHKNHPFSTHDVDRDDDPNQNRALMYRSGWWYYANSFSNLNGDWDQSGNLQGAYWVSFSARTSVTSSEMKVRRVHSS